MRANDNTGHKDKQGFPLPGLQPLNIDKIPRDLDPQTSTQNPPWVEKNSDKQNDKKIRKDKNLDEALKGTFPASDPAQQP